MSVSTTMTTATVDVAAENSAHSGHRIMVFAGRATPELAAEIGRQLGTGLSPVTLKTFSAGEVYCRYDESIRGADVFLVQSICGNPRTGVNTNDALMELLVMIDAARGASARHITAVTPWLGYSRQDKKSASREPISARLVARILESAGADRVLAMDLHAGQIQGMFAVPLDHMTATIALAQYVRDLRLPGDLVVVAPDVGRVKHSKSFAGRIGATLAILDKERPVQQVAEIGHVIGDVAGRTAIIVDDIVDTAGTLAAACRAVAAAGATGIYALATHGVLSGGAFATLADAPLERLVVTDTIPLPADAPDWVHVVSCAGVLTDTISRIYTRGSVSAVFGGKNNAF